MTHPPQTQRDEEIAKTLTLCCQALDDKKAEDIRILRLQGISTVADYFILATGTSEPHLRALTQEVLQTLKAEGIPTLGAENGGPSGWNVIDTFDVLVHVFLPATRETYRLDALWRDGDDVPLDSILKPAALPHRQN